MKVIIPTRIADMIEPRMLEITPSCSIVHVDQECQPDGDISDADVFFRWWSSMEQLRQLLESAPRLRWIHTPSAGVDHLLIPEIIEREIMLTNSAGAHAISISEFVLLFLLGHAKQVHNLVALTPQNAWERARQLHLNELYGKTLLIVGLGHIGQEIARRAAGFGMRVLGSRRRPEPVAGVERVVGEGEWTSLLPEADYVVIAAPLTSATRGMFDGAVLARMKRDAYLINIARGEIIETDALIAALHERRIAGAALDTLPEEPLPPEHPLWSAPNVWITPHISWSSPHINQRVVDIFLENVRRYHAGAPLLNLVDKTAGY